MQTSWVLLIHCLCVNEDLSTSTSFGLPFSYISLRNEFAVIQLDFAKTLQQFLFRIRVLV